MGFAKSRKVRYHENNRFLVGVVIDTENNVNINAERVIHPRFASESRVMYGSRHHEGQLIGLGPT